ncbi:hypothetical protein RN001_007787 [Aquatica leii]|uniref:YqaJ viral recombinase domain-containing protein n=1 Tax=Aquatica leii TaxID=1421715 RepID=A0AAN7PCB4_9COLE|nr:hypothetical protein RN001_007787 [Aquatica leii]
MGFGCSFFNAEVISEKIEGFESVLTFKCNMCGKVDVIRTGDTNSSFGSANRASVVGGLSIGIGYTQLAQLFAAMDIPQMSNGTYLKHHNGISKWVTNLNQHLMSVASKEETELADEKNEDGIPIIAVIADGAWGKRSYRRNYSALSGASIIGAKSKKNLYMGVKNKYCYLCTRGRDVSDHTCFRNWNKTSTSMEAGIICECFADSISRHNLIYGQLIGDGDSSVYRHLTELAPYGPTFYIRKIECRNHLLRNYINKLSDLSKNSSFPKSRRDYVCSLSTLGRFRNAVVKAVQYRKRENLPIDTKIENLRRDVLNSPFHILGRHERCQEYFCSGKGDDENLVDIYFECGMLQVITTITQRLADQASSLLYDTDNNPAETYNAIVAKFIGGKRINFSLKNSYQLRCEMAAISFNSRGKLLSLLHKDICGRAPGYYMSRFLDTQIRRYRNKTMKHYPKMRFATADADYGIVDENNEPDLPKDEYDSKLSQFLKKLENIDRKKIEEGTLTQSKNDLWKAERRKRITACNFGKICKLRPTTCTSKTVSFLLYNIFKGNKYTAFGLDSESVAIQQFEETYNLKVTICSLIIDKEKPFLACSPDGFVNDDAIIEIKSSLKAGDMDPLEACKSSLINYCVVDSENKMTLKRNHNYYYQLQGILQITKRTKCYFIVYTMKGIHFEVIKRDNLFWTDRMVAKLETFYFHALLPELVDPRRCRNLDLQKIYLKI